MNLSSHTNLNATKGLCQIKSTNGNTNGSSNISRNSWPRKQKAIQENVVHHHDGIDKQLKGKENTQASEAPISGIKQYFKTKRQRPEPESQERQDSPERKRRGFLSFE